MMAIIFKVMVVQILAEENQMNSIVTHYQIRLDHFVINVSRIADYVQVLHLQSANNA